MTSFAPVHGGCGRGKPLLGILGGMGPAATLDFASKILEATMATCDQDHLRIIISNDPCLPDRTEAVLAGDEDPVLVALLDRAHRLVSAGATAIAIPCNSAHHWHSRLQERLSEPVFHIAACAVRRLDQLVAQGAQVAILATQATLRAGFYQSELSRRGYPLAPIPMVLQEQSVDPAIAAAKAGRLGEARAKLQPALDYADRREIPVCILACTELPLCVPSGARGATYYFDATRALAEHCVQWAQAAQGDAAPSL